MQEDNELQFGTFLDEERFNGEVAFQNMRSEFHSAAVKYPTELHESFYIFAGQRVRMRVVGSELASHIGRPFSHLRIERPDSAPPQLTIEIWDKNRVNGGYKAPLNKNELEWTEMTLHSKDRRYVAQQLPHTLSCLDRDSSHIMASIAWHNKIFIYERAKPLARLLLEWHNDRNLQIIHTGLVARCGKGILFVGKSGSGKSTSSLACTSAGFRHLSEDYVALQLCEDGSFVGHSLYNSIFLKTDNLERFADLAACAIRGRLPQEEKSVVILSQVFPERLERAVPIRALALPRITESSNPRLLRASKGEALLALGPSSLLQIPNRGLGVSGFDKLAKLVERVPCFWLEVTRDLQSIAHRVDELLASLD